MPAVSFRPEAAPYSMAIAIRSRSGSPRTSRYTNGNTQAAYIPECDIRLEIYRRLARLDQPARVEEARDELTDRFGTLPPELEALLDLTRLRLLCRQNDVLAVHAGPAAVALTPINDAMNVLLSLEESRRSGDRVILRIAEASPATRLRRLLAAFDQIIPAVRDAPSDVQAAN